MYFPCVHVYSVIKVLVLFPTLVGCLPLRWAFALSLRTASAWHTASDFKKIKRSFFSRASLENLHRRKLRRKTSLYVYKASKIKGLRGVQKISPIQPEQMFGARYDPHIPWSPIFQSTHPSIPVISTLLTVIHPPKHYVIPRNPKEKPR